MRSCCCLQNEPLPLPVHDELWTLIDDMKLKAELASILPTRRALDVWTRLFKIAARLLIAEGLTRHVLRLHLMTSPSFETALVDAL